MNNRIRLAVGIHFIPRYRMIASVDIELVCLRILLVYIYLANTFLLKGEVEQGSAISLSFLRRKDEEHLNHFLAQPHKRSDIGICDDIQIDSIEIYVSYASTVILQVFFKQELMGTPYGLFLHDYQLILQGVCQMLYLFYCCHIELFSS